MALRNCFPKIEFLSKSCPYFLELARWYIPLSFITMSMFKFKESTQQIWVGLPSDCKQTGKRIARFQREGFSTFGIRNPVLSGRVERKIDSLFKNFLPKQKDVYSRHFTLDFAIDWATFHCCQGRWLTTSCLRIDVGVWLGCNHTQGR